MPGFTASRRVRSMGAYAFAEVDAQVARLRERGIEPVDFGVGDPSVPTPERVRRACQQAVDRHATSGYPSYVGSLEFREAVAAWTLRRHGVRLDPRTEVASTIGSKEAIFHFHEAVLDPGDVVLAPSPGYPPYLRGTLFAEGESWCYPLTRERGFLPDLDAIPTPVLLRARLLWINYPNSPTGRVAPPDFLRRVVEFGRRHGLVVASDEAYSELGFTPEAPHSLLEFGRERCVVFQSLSKRSAMTGYRVGWVAGDPEVVAAFKKLKTNIDSGTPNFVQAAAIEALSDEDHVRAFREDYRQKRDLLCEGLVAAGLPDCTPEGTIYVWQRAPEGMSGVDFARRLLADEVAVVVTPGEWLAEPVADGSHPGAGHVRFALVPSLEDTRKVARRIAALRLTPPAGGCSGPGPSG